MFESRKDKVNQEFPLPGAIQKRLITDFDFDKEKKLTNKTKQKKLEEKKRRKQEGRRQTASKYKELRQIKNAEKEKITKNELWGSLQELSSSFAKLKEKKQSKTLIKRRSFNCKF